MAYNLFLDINIIVDAYLAERQGNNDAWTIISAGEVGLFNLFLSESVINTTAYLTSKSIKADMFKRGINEMLSFITVLPCSNETVIKAYHTAKNDLEQAVLYQIALDNKMDYFVTSDLKDYKKIAHPLLPVISAKKMVELLEN